MFPEAAIFPSTYSYTSPIVSRLFISRLLTPSTILVRVLGLGIRKVAFSIKRLYALSFLSLRFLMKIKASLLMVWNIFSASKFTNVLQRMLLYGTSLSVSGLCQNPSLNTGALIVPPSILAAAAFFTWASSSIFIKKR